MRTAAPRSSGKNHRQTTPTQRTRKPRSAAEETRFAKRTPSFWAARVSPVHRQDHNHAPSALRLLHGRGGAGPSPFRIWRRHRDCGHLRRSRGQLILLAEIPWRGRRGQSLSAYGRERSQHAWHNPDSGNESSGPPPGRRLSDPSPERHRWEHLPAELLPASRLVLDGLGDGITGTAGMGILGHRPAGFATSYLSADRLRV